MVFPLNEGESGSFTNTAALLILIDDHGEASAVAVADDGV